jgi:DNA-binding MarR family transcriptional regulator
MESRAGASCHHCVELMRGPSSNHASIAGTNAMTEMILPPKNLFLREDAIRGGMDLLLFINTRHLKRADEKLASLGLGRAHHRVMYFVARKPGMSISELLELLAVTKQSLGRVSNALIDKGLLDSRVGDRDRRQRLLRLTAAGTALEQEIFQGLHDNVAQAYAASGADAVAGFWLFAQHLIGAEGRSRFRAVHGETET